MLVGRELELQTLNTAYDLMLGGRGSVLFLTGEAGLGKTALVRTWRAEGRELRAEGRGMRDEESLQRVGSSSLIPHPSSLIPSPSSLIPRPSSLFLESACSIPIGNVDVGEMESFQLWADVVAQLDIAETKESPSASGTTQGAGPAVQKLDIRKLIHDAAPSWAWALPFIGDIAHAALETSRLMREQREVHKRDPEDPVTENQEPGYNASIQQHVFQQYVNLLTKVSEATPLVIFLDDMHWSDASSTSLLFYLSRQIATKRILVIATYRAEDALMANNGNGHPIITVKNEIVRYGVGKEVTLGYLTRSAIRELLHGTFPEYIPDDRFEHWLVKISDGNSLFVTQFIKTLHEDGHLSDKGEFTGEYANITIPDSALAVVTERTRRLTDATRKLLSYATVEGEEFTTYVLEHLTDMKPMELLEDLQAATQIGIIHQRGTAKLFANKTTGIFGFSHSLFHKALYDSLLEMQKRYLHQQCFELIKAEWDRLADSKARTTTLGAKLLTHAEKCEEWETTAEVALALARQSADSMAHDEALSMFDTCLRYCEHTGNDIMRGEVKYLQGKICQYTSRYDESFDYYASALQIFNRLGNKKRTVDTINGQANGRYRQSRYEESLALSALIVHADSADRVNYPKGEATALLDIGLVHSTLGDNELSLRYFEQCLAIFTSIGNHWGEATALGNIGLVHRNLRDYALSLSYQEKSLEIHASIGNREGEAAALLNIGNVHHDRGDFALSLSYYERSRAIYAFIGNLRGESIAWGSIGVTQRSMGNFLASRIHLTQALALAREIKVRSLDGEWSCELGLLCELEATHLAGDDRRAKLGEAIEQLEQGIAIFAALKRPKEVEKRTLELARVRKAL